MKAALREIFSDTRDVIALLLVLSYCASIFLPEEIIGTQTREYFNTVILMVLGYFFGRAPKVRTPEMPSQNNTNPPRSLSCNDVDCINRK